MKISLIGSGNVATVLGRKMQEAGHQILQVFSPNEKHASKLAGLFNCGYASSWKNIESNADIYMIAIADDALQQIDKNLSLHHKLVVHTAGSVSKSVLKNVSTNYGVIYPLQSLRKEIQELPKINFLVDGNTEDDLTLIEDFVKTFGDKVEKANDDERLKLHVAAVIVSNFSNHLYALAEKYCIDEKVDFNLLLPLIAETATRLQYGSAAKMQTGPAVRNDTETIQKHLEALHEYPSLQKLFDAITKSIRDYYGEFE
ncbi:MAG: DUF2520 domain-containing protein [Bacteroidetes bacterium]|nr:DUF2520 domain-containing protein [Bacteroidota bacterium]